MRSETLLLMLCATTAAAQKLDLRIVSPKNGTVVAPGAVLEVTVEARASVDHVMLVGRPLGFDNVLRQPPYRFRVRIDPNSDAGPEELHAVAEISEGGIPRSISSPLTIDIERPDSPDRLANNLPKLFFEGVGDDAALSVMAYFPDGGVMQVNRSTMVRFRSESPAVATVDEGGHVIARGVGSTRILIRYRDKSLTIPVTVPGNEKENGNSGFGSWAYSRVRQSGGAGSRTLPTNSWNRSALVRRLRGVAARSGRDPRSPATSRSG
jgi:hypothetical protein